MIDGKMTADDTSVRIDWLVKHVLTEIATDFSGWDVLYQDPKDGRYWELTYPQSEMHGGGPPRLRYMPEEEARKKYGIGKH
jgi:hypothetical protein